MKINKPNAGTVWTLVGVVASVIGVVASNKKEASNMDTIAEKAADIMEKRKLSEKN